MLVLTMDKYSLKKIVLIVFLALISVSFVGICVAENVKVITTMPSVFDVTKEVGGNHIDVIYIQPGAGVHIQSDVIDGVIQKNAEKIKVGEIFIAQGGMDDAGIKKVTDFREKNFDMKTEWNKITDMKGTPFSENPDRILTNVYNEPDSLKSYAATVCQFLFEKDPENKSSYVQNWKNYCEQIDKKTKLTPYEIKRLKGTPVIRHRGMDYQTISWLGMDDTSIPNNVFRRPGDEAVLNLINDIHARPDFYKNVADNSKTGIILVVDNAVASPDIAKGIHEALIDENIPSKRIILQNQPKMEPNVDTNIDFYIYNKNKILQTLPEIPGLTHLSVVTTMPSVFDVVKIVGGNKVTAIYILPAVGVHINTDVIDATIQKYTDELKDSDIFIAQGGMDTAGINKVIKFREANFNSETDWKLISDVKGQAFPEDTSVTMTNVYNDPESLKGYAAAACKFLIDADPENRNIYLNNWKNYCDEIDRKTKLSSYEKSRLRGTPVIRHKYMVEQTITWMGMDDESIENNTFTNTESTKEIIDDIHSRPEHYRYIAKKSETGIILVVDNYVAGPDNAKGIHEALKDKNIPAERIILQNQPKMQKGIDTILDFYIYNKNKILENLPEKKSGNSAGGSFVSVRNESSSVQAPSVSPIPTETSNPVSKPMNKTAQNTLSPQPETTNKPESKTNDKTKIPGIGFVGSLVAAAFIILLRRNGL